MTFRQPLRNTLLRRCQDCSCCRGKRRDGPPAPRPRPLRPLQATTWLDSNFNLLPESLRHLCQIWPGHWPRAAPAGANVSTAPVLQTTYNLTHEKLFILDDTLYITFNGRWFSKHSTFEIHSVKIVSKLHFILIPFVLSCISIVC